MSRLSDSRFNSVEIRDLVFGIKNIYKLKPLTTVAILLQYSGSRVEHKDRFSSHK